MFEVRVYMNKLLDKRCSSLSAPLFLSISSLLHPGYCSRSSNWRRMRHKRSHTLRFWPPASFNITPIWKRPENWGFGGTCMKDVLDLEGPYGLITCIQYTRSYISIRIPAFSKGCCLNPKGWCIGTPYHPLIGRKGGIMVQTSNWKSYLQQYTAIVYVLLAIDLYTVHQFAFDFLLCKISKKAPTHERKFNRPNFLYSLSLPNKKDS